MNLRNEYELLSKEKVSLEELNSTWSQKNVDQAQEIEKLKEQVNELERLLEEKEKETGIKNVTVTRMEDDFKKEVSLQVYLKGGMVEGESRDCWI